MGLVYYPDSRPGIARRRCGRGFSYVAPDGTRIDRGAERKRLESMAVPPAYERVWMSPKENGHLMASGYDARERKQYRYHPEWTAERSVEKFASLAAFGAALPAIRDRVAADLEAVPGEKEFALAAAVLLIDRTAIRVGHPQYTVQNGSYGATTLTRRNMRLDDKGLKLAWVAKGGKKVARRIQSKRLMRALTQARDLPGAELLTWIDHEGEVHQIDSTTLNRYLAEAGGCNTFTAKTFRTWSGSLAAWQAVHDNPGAGIKVMADAAAARLANTPTVARNSYIHPEVIALAGSETRPRLPPRPRRGLSREETALLNLLEQS